MSRGGGMRIRTIRSMRQHSRKIYRSVMSEFLLEKTFSQMISRPPSGRGPGQNGRFGNIYETKK